MPAFKKGAREMLSQLAFWVILAYFVLACVVAGLFSLSRNQAHESAAREASARATATTQVAQCYASVKNAPIIDGFVDSHEAIIENGLIANEQALKITGTADPLYIVRVRSIARLKKAKRNADQLRTLIDSTTPTGHSCALLAVRLDVDPSRYIKRSTR